MISTSSAIAIAAYDSASAEYARRIQSDLVNDTELVSRVWHHIGHLSNRPRVLDVGCGAGVNLAMFNSLGCETTGLDISPQMVALARSTSPESNVLQGDVMDNALLSDTFDLVFAKAFIHLFDLKDFSALMSRLTSLLVTDGVMYAATTVHEKSSQGYYPKWDYANAPVRFRRFWDVADLLQAFEDNSMRVVDSWYNTDQRSGKHWMNYCLTKDM